MSIWDSAVERHVVELFKNDGAAAQVYFEVLGRLRHRFYDQSVVDALFQRWDGKITIEDAYCFGQLWAEIGSGVVFMRQFDIGVSPRADKEQSYNHRALQQLKKCHRSEISDNLRLSVDFFGGSGDQDGSVVLKSDLVFRHEACEDGCCPARRAQAPKKTWLPLEVGTTTAARSLGHLRSEHGLARWPYDSNVVTFFYVPSIYDISSREHPYMSGFAEIFSALRK